MIQSLLLSLTLALFSSPLPHLPFNFFFTQSETAIHTHHATCTHHHFHAAQKVEFGEAMGKVIKEQLNTYEIRTLVLDPGHGGKDPGCSGSSSKEKHIALAVAQTLRDQLKAAYPELNVIMTRDSDEFIPLNERANIANRNKADLFISIHCNYIPKYFGTKGTETYVLGLHRAEDNLNVAKRENSAILYEQDYEQTYDGFDPDSDEGHIVLSMYQSAFLEQSILFGSLVENRFAEAAQRKSRGVKQAGFLVLRETAMPSVLVETGFLSNKSEEQFLKSKSGQIEMANAIFEAFELYKNTVEGKTTSPIVASLQTSTPQEYATAPQTSQMTTRGIDLPKRTTSTPVEVRQVKRNVEKELPTEAVTRRSAPTKVNVSPRAGALEEKPTTKSDSPIQYRVQIAASKDKVNTAEQRWRDIPYIVEIIWEDGYNKYQIRNLNSFEAADKVRIEMLHKGFMGAFIVAFQDGKRLSTKELSGLR
ncbi:MAG: N-acetylmuramoyl-L-alanine amidase [Bacteroidota bacterium]